MPARDAFIVQLFIVPFACFGAAREKQVRRLPRAIMLLQNAAERADLQTHACAQRRVAYAEARCALAR